MGWHWVVPFHGEFDSLISTSCWISYIELPWMAKICQDVIS